MNYDQFAAKWIGQRVDYDHEYDFQCVDLIRQYWYECYGMPGGGGVPGAIDYWYSTPAVVLGSFYKVGSSEGVKGDVVILYGLPGNPYGHIGICSGNSTDSNIEILEQNGSTGNGSGIGGDAIRTRYVSRSRVAGLLRPMQVAELPAQEQPEVHPYTIELIDPKQVRTNKDTHRWGMTYDNFTAIAAHPLADLAANEVFIAAAICHHAIGYDYYLDNPNEPSGFNVLDCDDYYPPAPDPVINTTPSAPIPFPTTDEKYTLVTNVLGFTTSNQAINHSGTDPVNMPARSYFIYNKKFNENNTALLAVNITQEKGRPGAWVNVLDNFVAPEVPKEEPVVVPPVPAPVVTPPVVVAPVETEAQIRDSLRYFNADGSAITVEVIKTVMIFDQVKNGPPQTIRAGREVKIYGTFSKAGKYYALVKLKNDTMNYYMYGVPISTRANIGPYLEDVYDVRERVLYGLERLYDKARQTIDGFFQPKQRK